jgi:hypothetical protein
LCFIVQGRQAAVTVLIILLFATPCVVLGILLSLNGERRQQLKIWMRGGGARVIPDTSLVQPNANAGSMLGANVKAKTKLDGNDNHDIEFADLRYHGAIPDGGDAARDFAGELLLGNGNSQNDSGKENET